ncbi:MAG: hypothetical protein EB084_14520 [Proteobacteria bacterium]|nr:hypothetical protein [Pseudomonadota bacterium]
MTLQEVIITMPLFLLLLAMLYTQLQSSSRKSMQLTTQAQVHEAAVAIMSLMESDIRRTTIPGIRWVNATEGSPHTVLSLHPIEGLDNTGILAFNKELVVYDWHKERHTLTRRRWNPPPTFGGDHEVGTVEGFRPTDDELRLLISDSSPCDDQRLLGSDVTRLEITTTAPEEHVSNELTIKLTLVRKAVTNAEETRDIERVVYLHDS